MTLDRDIGLVTEHLTPEGRKKRRRAKGIDKDPNSMWTYDQIVANVVRLRETPPKSDFVQALKEKREERENYTDK